MRACSILALLFLLLSGPVVLANIRGPLVIPRGPSSAPFPVDPALHLIVLGEDLSFHCHGQGQAATCAVQARYRIQARAPVHVELSFVMPLPAPLTVTVGAVAAAIRVGVAPATALHEDEVNPAETHYHLTPLQNYQASFTASLIAGENTITVSYQQPLGQYEHGHSYFSKGKFTDFFRYELWPLSEWQHAPGFEISGEVTIDRPPPSWWKRTFSQPRSMGCWGLDPARQHELRQEGDTLRFIFKIVDPLPRRIWCHIGDLDNVPK